MKPRPAESWRGLLFQHHPTAQDVCVCVLHLVEDLLRSVDCGLVVLDVTGCSLSQREINS